ncbi:hypothetical protein [Janibacter indicus]|uniref:hypothetical protein n=1 Tax=Janibacter indicus TaxID=857417 RepID=UPI003D9A2750
MSAQDVWPSFAGMWCGAEGSWTDETARAHFDGCQDCQDALAAFEAQQRATQAVAFTQRIAGHLRASLRRAGHDVEVSDNPTVEELAHACELLGTKLSDFLDGIDATCPAWCSSHPSLEPGTHVGEVTVGDVVLGLCLEPGEDVTVHLPDDVEAGLTPAQASALGDALTQAARTIGYQ